MIDVRKLDVWYTNNLANLRSINQKKKIFLNKSQEKTNRKKIINFAIEESERLSIKLNQFHKTKYSKKIWTNVLFKWLFFTIDNIYTNHEIFQKILDKKEKFKIYKFKISKNTSVTHLKTDPEAFHNFLISEFIKFKKFKYKEENFKISKIQKKRKKFLKKKSRMGFFKKCYIWLSNILLKSIGNPKFIISDIGITFKENIFLNLKLGQFPYYIHFKKEKWEYSYLKEKRKELFLYKGNNDFKKFYYRVTELIFPAEYLELFSKIEKNFENLFPKKPNYFLSNNIYDLEEKAFYLMKLRENKTKLYIFQHGGLYGTHYYPTGELTEKKIANKFLTWGWKKNKQDIPFYALPFCKKKKDINKFNSKKKKILLCVNLSNRFLNTSSDIQRNNLDRLIKENSINNLTKKIKIKYQKKLTIRYLKRAENSGMNFSKKNFPKNIKFDEGEKNFFNICKDYNLIIHDTITTSGLESMSFNKPTLFLIDNKMELFNSLFKTVFKEMIKHKIVHLNHKSLANFLNENYENINEWWTSGKVKNVKQKFVNLYAKTNELYQKNLVKKLKNLK